ncbi:uncharacterized protein LOC118403520 [Branchiostoma floridae]|uniref:Uncharacterized protein LOC118403520 n=1 Tax=Branchiostoma floridae TaxID=7739 RepID=A0A9J7KDW6_BRAFL|nr:uncharacterized protein LOC118403520 [Branchiostoma floridae]
MKDTSFHPSDFTSDSENEEEIDCGEDEGGDDGEDDFISGDDDSQYYVVHKDKIRERFKTCHCGEPLLITEQFTTGSMLTVKYECTSFHRGTWESQPKVGRMAEGNLLTSAAILFAGGSYQKFSDICNTLKLKLFSETYFMNVQRTFLLPAINDFYISQQEFTLDAFRNAGTESPEDQIQVTLLGDGRCDTPGHNAKYCSYSLMEETSQLILDFQLVQVSETTSSNAMERLGFERSLDFLEEEGIKIDCIVTDRHRGVGAVLKKRRDINHQFDLFHFAKSITKKLTQEASRRAKKDLGPWIKFIVNHLWHISDTCQGDDVLLQEKWLSMLKHIGNIHVFPENSIFTQCAHPHLDRADTDDIMWLRPGSPPHQALYNIATNKTLLKDLSHLTGFKHTGTVEVFHSMLLKYAPKRQHYFFHGMKGRLQLAVLDHNENVLREQAKTLEDEARRSAAFSKRTKRWVYRRLFEGKTYEFREYLMADVVRRQASGQYKCGKVVLPDPGPDISGNIAPEERGDKQAIIDGYMTRFGLR